MYSNEEATLSLYKENVKGMCRDYVIRFKHNQQDIEHIIPLCFDIVSQLINDFHRRDKTVKGRLVALVHYTREATGAEVRAYHPSCQSEVLEDAKDFFITHMLKIVERMSDFNRQGSNLQIESISEVHLHITCIN